MTPLRESFDSNSTFLASITTQFLAEYQVSPIDATLTQLYCLLRISVLLRQVNQYLKMVKYLITNIVLLLQLRGHNLIPTNTIKVNATL